MLLSEMTSVFLSAFTYLALIAVLGNIGGNALIYLSDKEYPSKKEYFNLARVGFIAGLVFAVLVAAYFLLPGEPAPHRASAGDFLELLWVAPIASLAAAFLIPTTTALGTMLITSSTIKSPASVWHGVGKLLAKPLGRWCALLERLTRNG